MMDERLKPYAEWLESLCKEVAENQPASCAFVFRTKSGDVSTGYFGEAANSVFEKSQLSFAIQQDALMGTVYANADYIKRQAEEIEGENADQ